MFNLCFQTMQMIYAELENLYPNFPQITPKQLRQLLEQYQLLVSQVDTSCERGDSLEIYYSAIKVLSMVLHRCDHSADNFFTLVKKQLLAPSVSLIYDAEKSERSLFAISQQLLVMRQAFVYETVPTNLSFLLFLDHLRPIKNPSFRQIELIAFILWLLEHHCLPIDIIKTGIIQKYFQEWDNYTGAAVDDPRNQFRALLELVTKDCPLLVQVARLIDDVVLKKGQKTSGGLNADLHDCSRVKLTLTQQNIMNIRLYDWAFYAYLLYRTSVSDDYFFQVMAVVGIEHIKTDDLMFQMALQSPEYFGAISKAVRPASANDYQILTAHNVDGRTFFQEWLIANDESKLIPYIKVVSSEFLYRTLSAKDVKGNNALYYATQNNRVHEHICTRLNKTRYLSLIESKNENNVSFFNRIVDFPGMMKTILWYYFDIGKNPPLSDLSGNQDTPMHHIVRQPDLLICVLTICPSESYKKAFWQIDSFGRTPLDYLADDPDSVAKCWNFLDPEVKFLLDDAMRNKKNRDSLDEMIISHQGMSP